MANPPGPLSPADQEYFQEMVKARKRLVRPMVVIILVVFFLQQILTNFTSVMDGFAFPGMSWAYLYSFALFFVVVILTTIYRRGMDAVESKKRPSDVEEPVAAHYDDPEEWESHERLLEVEEDERKALEDQAAIADDKEAKP